MAIEIKTYNDILTQLKQALTLKTGIPFPFNEGDVITTLLEGIALQLADIYASTLEVLRNCYIGYAEGQALTLRASEITDRRPEEKAGGYVVFKKSADTFNQDITVPVGTEVAVPATEIQTELKFRLTQPVVIPAGVGEGTGYVLAVKPGTEGNIQAGQITKLNTTVIGITAVENPNPFGGGRDRETDVELRMRVKNTILGLVRATYPSLTVATYNVFTTAGQSVRTSVFVPITGNKHYLVINDGTDWEPTPVSGAMEFTQVPIPANLLALPWYPTLNTVSVSAGTTALNEGIDYWVVYNYKQVILKNPVSTGTTYTVTASYYNDDLIKLLYDEIGGDLNDPINKPGYLPAGVQILIKPAGVIKPLVEVSITVASGYDVTEVKNNTISAIQDLLNSKLIAYPLYKAEIIETVMSVEGVSNCILESPIIDILPGSDRVVRAGTIIVNV